MIRGSILYLPLHLSPLFAPMASYFVLLILSLLYSSASVPFPVNDGGFPMSAISAPSSPVILTGGSTKTFTLGTTDLSLYGWTDPQLGALGVSWYNTHRPSWTYNSDYLVLSQPAPYGYGGSTNEGPGLLSMPGAQCVECEMLHVVWMHHRLGPALSL